MVAVADWFHTLTERVSSVAERMIVRRLDSVEPEPAPDMFALSDEEYKRQVAGSLVRLAGSPTTYGFVNLNSPMHSSKTNVTTEVDSSAARRDTGWLQGNVSGIVAGVLSSAGRVR